MSLSADQILRKAARHAKNGETELAAQQYQSVLEKYPQNQRAIEGLKALQQPSQQQTNDLITLFNQGNFQQALQLGETLEQQFPDNPLIPNLLGAANYNLRRLEQAVASYSKALLLDPKNAQLHNNVAISLMELGRIDEAEASLNKALQIKPSYAEAHNNLANLLKDQGNFKEAVVAYRKALKSKPDYAEAHNNLGVALKELGETEDSVASYTKALQIKPDYAQAHNNLAVALKELGKIDQATAHFKKSVALDSNNLEFWQNFSFTLRLISFEVYDEEWANIFLNLLGRKTIERPKQLVRPIVSLLKGHPAITKALQLAGGDDIQESSWKTCNSLAEIPLLLCIMELCPIPDLELEKLLRTLRRALLLNHDMVDDRQSVLSFLQSLALHCFTNEYVFAESKEETLAIQALEADVERTFAEGEQASPYKVACLASYRPLHNFEWSQQWLVPESLKELFEWQVQQVLEESRIRAEIQTLGQIDDQVSKEVRAQYEDNPYPRWINTALSSRPMNILTHAKSFKLKLSDDNFSFADAPEILIAGCGTGQQSLGIATRILNSKTLAIDLSLSSLSYAIRKTAELGISNIEYLQADILDLDSMERQFDLIECVGVLHHMADPMTGWKIITDRLKPGGLMKIGLYSELARQSVVEARALILEMGLSHATEDMLKFRSEIIDSNEEMLSKFRKFINFNDFFNTSEFRDLLFHVQEHRFTIPQIKESLDVLGLSFAGFETSNNNMMKIFTQTYPDPQSLYNLDTWHEFELAHADAFAGMYQFWVQKKINL